MFLTLLGLVIISLIYLKVIRPYNYWSDRGVKHTKPTYILGDTGGITFRRESMLDFIEKLYNVFSNERYIGIYQFFMPTLVVRDRELVKQITVKNFDHFVDHKSFLAGGLDPLSSKNLFGLRGEEWRDMRTILSPAFTGNKMKTMFSLISESAAAFVDYFAKLDQELIELNLSDACRRYANDVIATTAFGIKCDSLREKENEFYMMGMKATNITGFWQSFKFLFLSAAPNICKFLGVTLFSNDVIEFFKKIVTETIKTREENNIVRPDMLQLMMEAKRGRLKHEEPNGTVDEGFATVQESKIHASRNVTKHEITDIDIAAQAFVFFFGGFDSIATAQSLMGHELATHPEIQKKLQEEINATLEECKGELTYEALVKMKYMDMVVSETMRLWSPGIVLDRVCVKPFTMEPVRPNEKPLRLKTGDVLWIPMRGFHKDPRFFPNPDVFDPERFSDENKHKIQPYTYFPFGLGPRNCIASRFAIVEMKTLFFHALAKFDFVPIEKTLPLKLKKTLSITAVDGFWIGLKRKLNHN